MLFCFKHTSVCISVCSGIMWTEVATVGYYYYYYKSTDLSDTLQKHANGALYKIMKVQRAYQ